MLYNLALLVVGIIVLSCMVLCCCVLVAMWQIRTSKRTESFFYRCCWNEGFINLFTLVFFLTTMYGRFFTETFSTFIYLNRFPWWTKFAQITQEHLLYMHIMNVFLTVGSRFCTVCLSNSLITHIAEQMTSWEIFLLQISLPTLMVIPLYCIYEHRYELGSIPIFLSAIRPDYDRVISIIKVIFRASAFGSSFFSYIYMFWTVRKKANRKEVNILVHGGCLLSALGGSFVFDCNTGKVDKNLGLFYFTSILWVPCTDIVTTFCVVTSLRKRARPLKEIKATKITAHSRKITANITANHD